MGQRPAQVALVSLGDATWEEPEGTYRVLDEDRTAGQVHLVVETPDGDAVVMAPLEVYRRLNRFGFDAQASADNLPQVDPLWRGVPRAEQARCEKRARDLRLMATGSPFGDLNGGPVPDPDPDYDPALVPRGQAVERMSRRLRREREKGSSTQALRRQLALLRQPGGARNLVHGSYGKDKLGLEALPSEVTAVVLEFGRSRRDTSDLTAKALVAEFRRWSGGQKRIMQLPEQARDAVRGLTDGQVEGLLYRHCPELFLPAQTRRATTTRDRQHQGKYRATAPYQVVEVDATPLDLLAVGLDGKVLPRIFRLSIVDAYTGKTLAFAYTTRLNSAAVRALLWLMVSQQWLDPGTGLQPAGAPHLPERVHILPGMQIQDRGTEYNNYAHALAAAGLEVMVVSAPPGRGDKKPHVESSHRGAALLWERLPGATGANTTRRGRYLEKGPLLRIDQVLQLEAAYIEAVVHNAPSKDPQDPAVPGVKLSPNQIEDLYYRNGGLLATDPDPFRALHLLDATSRKFQPEGIRVASRWYRLADRAAFADLGYVPGQEVTVYRHDLAHDYVIIRHGRSGIPVVLPDAESGAPVPPLADAITQDLSQILIGGGKLGRRDLATMLDQVVACAHDLARPAAKPATPAPAAETQPDPEPEPQEMPVDPAVLEAEEFMRGVASVLRDQGWNQQ